MIRQHISSMQNHMRRPFFNRERRNLFDDSRALVLDILLRQKGRSTLS